MSNVPKLRFPEFTGEWEEKRIDSIFDEIKDKNHPSEEVLTIIQGTGTVSRKSSGRNIIFDEKSLSNYKYVRKDDFIIHLRSFEGGLEIANSNGIVSPAYIIMRSKFPIAPRFFYSYFRSYKFINHVLPIAVEGVRDGRQIKYPILKEEKIPFPSHSEQQKIADFLSNVDSIIAAETKILNSLQKKKKALMQKLFTQQLRFKQPDDTDFPTWEEKKLGEIAEFKQGYQIFFSEQIQEPKEGYLRYLYISDFISDKKILYVKDEESYYHISEKDICVANTGATSGKPFRGQTGILSNNMFKIFLSDVFDEDFAWQFFNSPCYENELQTFMNGAGQPHIGHKNMSSIHISLPCKAEQQKIADCLSSMDSLIQNQQKVVTTWQQRKKALLQQMFI